MIDHPCELYGKSLDCKSRHLNNAVGNLGNAIKNEAQKASDTITTAWTSAFNKMRGHTNETD